MNQRYNFKGKRFTVYTDEFSNPTQYGIYDNEKMKIHVIWVSKTEYWKPKDLKEAREKAAELNDELEKDLKMSQMENNVSELTKPTFGDTIQLKEFDKPCYDGWWGIVNVNNDIEQVVLVFKEQEDEDFCVRYEDGFGNIHNDELEDFLKVYPFKLWVGYIPMKYEKG